MIGISNNLAKHIWNVSRIDGQIYDRLSNPNPYNKVIEEIKYSIKIR